MFKKYKLNMRNYQKKLKGLLKYFIIIKQLNQKK